MRESIIMMTLVAIIAIVVGCGNINDNETASRNIDLMKQTAIENAEINITAVSPAQYAGMLEAVNNLNGEIFYFAKDVDFDAGPCLLKKIEEQVGNETILREERFYDDQQNRLVKKVMASNTSFWYEYIYDDSNGLLVERREVYYEDGSIGKVVYYQYDGSGNLTAMSVKPTDLSELDHVCYTYVYDSQNRLIAENRDQGCNGAKTWCWSYTYDGDGNLIEKERDTMCSGEGGENLRHYTISYNTNGDITDEVYDSGHDGVVEYEKSWLYDNQNRLSEYEMDSYISDSPQFNTTNHWTYTGSWAVENIGWNNTCHESKYSTNGRILEERWDADCDELYEEIILYSYIGACPQ